MASGSVSQTLGPGDVVNNLTRNNTNPIASNAVAYAMAAHRMGSNNGQYTSLDKLKSDLIAYAGTLEDTDARIIQFVFTSAVSPFSAWGTCVGWMHIIQKGATSLYFVCGVASNNAEHYVLGYSNGTWTIKKTTST